MTDNRRAPGGLRVPRVPSNVILLLSAATAGYGASLAAVASFQAADEAALMAARQPATSGVEELAAGHDQLAARLDRALEAYRSAADAYDRAGSIQAAVNRDLEQLAAAVAEIDGVARDLPTSVRVPVQRTVVRVQAPTTHATTGASGG